MNPANDQDTDAWAAEVLGGAAGPAAGEWAAARARLAAAAQAAAVVDVAFEQHDTPFGRVLIAATVAGVVRLGLPAEEPDAVLQALASKLSPRVLRAPRPTITQARRELDEYFGGARQAFDVPLDWALVRGFGRDVLGATSHIAYGSTASYGGVAAVAGNPRAVRAAGTALAKNPLPILIPCHRVLRANGAPGQYLGGVAMKTQLLQLEGAV